MDTEFFALIAALALVVLNAFFVAAEFALVKVRKTRIEKLILENKSKAKLLKHQVEKLDNYIAACQLGITLASIALGWIGEPALAKYIQEFICIFTIENVQDIAHTIAVTISFAIITIMHVVFGELIPKSLALQRTERVALFISIPLYIFDLIFRPFILLLNNLGNGLMNLFGLRRHSENDNIHSVEELEMLVTQGREEGVLDSNEEKMLLKIFDFNEKTAKLIMTPRINVFAVDLNDELKDLIKLVNTEQYTRIPVYHNNLDNILGIFHVKDLFNLISLNQIIKPEDLKSCIRPVLKVPENLSIEKLLLKMQKKQVHLAVIFNEYGGTSGIVTMEDILEEIVGEVRDEFDSKDELSASDINQLPDGSSIISGLMSLKDFSLHFKINIVKQDYNTIGGYISGQLDSIVKENDEIILDEYKLKVLEMDNLRVNKIQIIPLPNPKNI